MDLYKLLTILSSGGTSLIVHPVDPEPVETLQEPLANPERVNNQCMIYRSISGHTDPEEQR